MGKKSQPLFNKYLYLAGAVVAVTAIVGGSVYFLSKGSIDEDWMTVRRLQDSASKVKNEPKGCCPPHDGLFSKTECDQAAGYSWREGKCPGFAVKLTGTSHSNTPGGGTGDAKFTFDLHTCKESIYSTWQGTWDFDWVWTTKDGKKAPSSMKNQPISFAFSDEGKGSFVLATGMGRQTKVSFETDRKKVNFNIEWGNLAPVNGSAEIIEGSGPCVE